MSFICAKSRLLSFIVSPIIGLYPAFTTAAAMSASVITLSSYDITALPDAKFTATPSAVGSALSAFSTVPEHTTHVIPCTLKVSVLIALLASTNFIEDIITDARASVKLLLQLFGGEKARILRKIGQKLCLRRIIFPKVWQLCKKYVIINTTRASGAGVIRIRRTL